MLNTDMSAFRIELEDAIKSLGIRNYYVDRPEKIISEIKHTYVNGNPMAWWLSLKNRQNTFTYTDNSGYKNILRIVSEIFNDKKTINENVFFIADEDNECMYLYNIPLQSLAGIIENCRYFEYYIVAHDLSWLICENDHGDLIVCSNN